MYAWRLLTFVLQSINEATSEQEICKDLLWHAAVVQQPCSRGVPLATILYRQAQVISHVVGIPVSCAAYDR